MQISYEWQDLARELLLLEPGRKVECTTKPNKGSKEELESDDPRCSSILDQLQKALHLKAVVFQPILQELKGELPKQSSVCAYMLRHNAEPSSAAPWH